MSITVINARIIDQKVQLSNIPLIASGSQGVLQIECDFDDLWTGYQATAVFFREEKGKVTDVFHVPVYLGLAEVPPEVLKDEGHFFMGFMGVAENTRTTELIRLEVKRGAITEGVAVPDPTPDVYTQLLEILNQSGIIPDATLTQEGKAADAKATGAAIDKVRTDVSQMVGDVKEELLDMQAADRIIEYGVEPSTDKYEGNWYWKKYASGEARCYGRFAFGSIACTKSWGENGFRECEGMYKTVPEGLFIDIPLHLDISLVTGSGAAFITQDRGNDMTALQTGRFTLSRPSSMTLTNISLGFEVIGRWKAEDEPVEASAETE